MTKRENKKYVQPVLPYGNNELDPFLSEQQLSLHYQKHHQAYIDNANALLERLDQFSDKKKEPLGKGFYKNLSYNVGGHILHSLFWLNLTPEEKKQSLQGELESLLLMQYDSQKRFREEFTRLAVSVEGSGWAALVYCHETERLLLMQIEKHNLNMYPNLRILLVLDVWEHAYYLDYQQKREEYINKFWSFVNWQEVNIRFLTAVKEEVENLA